MTQRNAVEQFEVSRTTIFYGYDAFSKVNPGPLRRVPADHAPRGPSLVDRFPKLPTVEDNA